MRNLIFGLLSLVSFAALSACDDNGSGTVKIPDLAMIKSTDMAHATVLNGCNGFQQCLYGPNLDNIGGCPDSTTMPGFLDQTCVDACIANTTDQGLQLDFQASTGCIGKGFCQSGATPPCADADLDGSMQPSADCQACIDNINSEVNAAGQTGSGIDGGAALIAALQNACNAAFTACTNDKP